MKKPRMRYADFVTQRITNHAEGSVAWLIEKYIVEKSLPGRRQIGPSHLYNLRHTQRQAIGKKAGAKLKPLDYITHCSERIAKGAKPATVRQDLTFLIVVLK